MSTDWTRVDSVMNAATGDGTTPGAVALVGRGREVVFERAYGLLEAGGQAVTIETVYDLASLTKPLVTTACLLLLVADGTCTLDDPAATWLPELAAGPDASVRERISLADLLGHRSGLPAWRPYFEATDPASPCADTILAAAVAEPLECPPGTNAVYSDIGFMLLGRVVELAAGQSLGELAHARLLEPLDAGQATFVDVAAGQSLGPEGVAPCGHSTWRRQTVRGTSSDDNAYAMGGTAGHAGLFASVREVHQLVAEQVDAFGGKGAVLDTELVRRCWTERSVVGSTWHFGWDGPSLPGSTAGGRVAEDAIGHLGWSGTSVWIDPVRGAHVVLLSNRVHPDQDNRRIDLLRPAFYDAVFETLDG